MIQFLVDRTEISCYTKINTRLNLISGGFYGEHLRVALRPLLPPLSGKREDPFVSHIQSAEQLLIRGGGTALDREDALNFCLDGAGISAFAAGIRFCYQLLADPTFPAH